MSSTERKEESCERNESKPMYRKRTKWRLETKIKCRRIEQEGDRGSCEIKDWYR